MHRIGRTARAGAEGIAISLCDAEERDYLRDIERLTRQSIETTDRRRDPTLELAAEAAREGSGRRQSRGQPHGQSGKSRAHNGERQARPDTRGRPHRGGGNAGRNGAEAQDRRNGEPRPAPDVGTAVTSRTGPPTRTTATEPAPRPGTTVRPSPSMVVRMPAAIAPGRTAAPMATTMNAATETDLAPRTGSTVNRGRSRT